MDLSNKRKITSIILKIIVITSAIVGTIISYNSANEFMSGSQVFMYFTIQSNLLMALVCLIGLCIIFTKKKINNIWSIIKLVSTISITLTGLVFCFVLAPTLGANAWNLANILTHVIVPICAIIDFFIIGLDSNYKKNTCLVCNSSTITLCYICRNWL